MFGEKWEALVSMMSCAALKWSESLGQLVVFPVCLTGTRAQVFEPLVHEFGWVALAADGWMDVL
jgi:hypothetical protein